MTNFYSGQTDYIDKLNELSAAAGAIVTMTSTTGGGVPTPPNNTTTFLRGDGTFATPQGTGIGDTVLANTQTNSGLKTFLNATFGLRNVANTITSFFTTAATVTRTWVLPNKDGTIAMTSDITGSNTFTGAQIGTVTDLTSSAGIIAVNLATSNNFRHTMVENTTLSAPSNPVEGQSGVITITQGATARTLAYNTFWKFAGGTVPTLTATADAVDVFAYNVESATRATAQLIKDVK